MATTKQLNNADYLWNIAAKHNDHMARTTAELVYAQEYKVRELARFLARHTGKDMNFFLKKVGNVTSPLLKFRGLIDYANSIGIRYC
jgi:hypothetical protein